MLHLGEVKYQKKFRTYAVNKRKREGTLWGQFSKYLLEKNIWKEGVALSVALIQSSN